jgi:single-strand DNA-binding protein
MNVFTFTGNLGKDCRVGTGQTPMISFGVGVKSGFGDKAQTVWVDCVIWGKRAESRISECLLKGQAVCVSGELGTREHKGKTYVTCRVAEIDLIGGKSEGQQQPRQQEPQRQQPTPQNDDSFDDDIPF